MNKMVYFTIAAAGLISYANAWFDAGKNEFFSTSKRGWHYFEKDKDNNKTDLVKEKKKTDEQDEKFMASIPINNLDLLTAKQFTETFEKARGIAVMKPTKKNVAIVQKMNKWQIDQSVLFSKIWHINNLENPNLEFPDITSNKLGLLAKEEIQRKKQDRFFEDNKESLGFVVFVSSSNESVTSRQRSIYESFKRRYNVDVEYVDVDNNQDFVTALNLVTTPESFMLFKNSKGDVIWQRIKAGFISEQEIANNAIFLFENSILEKDK